VPTEYSVEVSVRFLTRFSTAIFSPAECPVCQRIALFSRESYPTRLIGEFAEWQKHECIRARTREEIVDTDPYDFHHRRLEGSSAIAMACFRDQLVEAITSTEMRESLYQVVHTWSDPEQVEQSSDSISLIQGLHFLSVELQWLEKPPLCFASVRENLSNAALRVALNSNIDIADRTNASTVLWYASPLIFVEKFADLFRSAIGQDKLLAQLLHDAFNLLTTGLRHSKSFLEILESNVHSIKMGITNTTIQVAPPLSETVDNLQLRARRGAAKADVRSLSQAEAWARLQLEFGYPTHDPVPTRILKMQPGRYAIVIEKAIKQSEDNPSNDDALLPEAVLDWVRSLEENWKGCCTFLDNNALPLLYRIKKVLQSEDANRCLGKDTVEYIVDFADQCFEGGNLLAESDFSRLVSLIARNPRQILIRKNWNYFHKRSSWFREGMLAALSDEDRPSRLVKMLFEAPVVLGSSFVEVYKKMLVAEDLPASIVLHDVDNLKVLDAKAFCFKDLFFDCVSEILFNVRNHLVDPNSRADVWVSIETLSQEVILSVKNTGTKQRQPVVGRGKGLKLLEKRLSSFDATLLCESRPNSSEISFAVNLTFKKGW
jgi:hypothetical protein